MTSRKPSADQSVEQPGEVERLVELVGAHERGHRLGGLGPGLGHGHPVGADLVEHLVPAPVDVVHLGLVPHRLVVELVARDHRVVGVDLARAGPAAGGDDLVAQRLPPCRGRAPRRCGTRRHRGPARSAARPRTCRRPRGCASRGRAGSGRTGGGTTGRPATRVQAGPPKTDSQLFGGSLPSVAATRRGTGSAPARASPGRPPARRGTTRARRRCGWAPGRRSPAARARGPRASRSSASASEPNSGSTSR